jgi:hypothetical protein
VASQSSDKGKKGGEKSKKVKKKKCFNCKKIRHFAKDCYAKGGGAKSQGLKQKGQDKDKNQKKDKGKDLAAKVEKKGSEDDGVWMGTVGSDEGIQNWVDSCGDDTSCKFEMWMDEEIVASDGDLIKEVHQVKLDYSPNVTNTSNDNIFFHINDLNISSVTEDESKSMPDLESVSDLTVIDDDVEEVEVSEDLVNELAIDNGNELTTHTFAATTLANIGLTLETELYDSSTSRHMSPYKHNFINFIPIQQKKITAADSGFFKATRKGSMHISMPNSKSMSKILLKNVLYTPKMDITLIPIGKIDAACYADFTKVNCGPSHL